MFEDLQIGNLTKAPKPKQDENGKYLPNGAAAKGGLNKSIMDRDVNAAINILALGYKQLTVGTRPTRAIA